MVNLKQLSGFILFLCAWNAHIFAQCPRLTGVMIDACGANEGINEYFTLYSGAGMPDVTALNIRYGTTNTFATSLVFDASVPNFWVTNAPYLANLNSQITVPGCTCQAAGTSIPANKNVVILSSTVGFNAYNLSALCAANANVIPVLFFDPTLTTGTGAIAGFNNSGNFGNYQAAPQTRFFEFSIDGQPACNTLMDYDRSLLLQSNGVAGQENGASITFESAGTTSYHNTGCTAPELPLPVQWGELGLVVSDNSTKVIWQTLNEINNARFYILKGEAPEKMEEIGSVLAMGNRETITQYEFLDPEKLEGKFFYQIEQEDINGNRSFSDYIISTYKENNVFHVENYYYNERENLVFEINSPNDHTLKLVIFDVQGKKVFEQSNILAERGESNISTPLPLVKNVHYFYYMYDEMGNASKGILHNFIH